MIHRAQLGPLGATIKLLPNITHDSIDDEFHPRLYETNSSHSSHRIYRDWLAIGRQPHLKLTSSTSIVRPTAYSATSVEDMDLVNRNEDGAEGGGWLFGTTPLQVTHKLPERFPDIYGRAVSSIRVRFRDDAFIEVHSM